MGRSRMFWGDKDQISLGREKEGIRGGYEGENQNENYVCKIPIIKQDTNFISQTVSQTNL